MEPPARGGRFRLLGQYTAATKSVLVTSFLAAGSLRSQALRYRPSTSSTIAFVRVIFTGQSYSAPPSASDITSLFFDGAFSVNGFFGWVSRGAISLVKDKNGDGQADIFTVAVPGSTTCFFIPDQAQSVLLAN